jgi:hypothetical protein
MLERMVAARIEFRAMPGLRQKQFGFRRGRSTIDAIVQVEVAERRSWVMLAVSLDIVNAFNRLPWEKIGVALEFHQVPPPLPTGRGSRVSSGPVHHLHRPRGRGKEGRDPRGPS